MAEYLILAGDWLTREVAVSKVFDVESDGSRLTPLVQSALETLARDYYCAVFLDMPEEEALKDFQIHFDTALSRDASMYVCPS